MRVNFEGRKLLTGLFHSTLSAVPIYRTLLNRAHRSLLLRHSRTALGYLSLESPTDGRSLDLSFELPKAAGVKILIHRTVFAHIHSTFHQNLEEMQVFNTMASWDIGNQKLKVTKLG